MILPGSEDELADFIRGAAKPVRVQGGGTRFIGQVTTPDILSTSKLSGITLYDPGALTIVARAGTSVAEIVAALDAENQMLAFEPMDFRTLLSSTGTPTIGGVVASNSSGPRRIRAGACRDFLLGVRFVTGQGEIVKNGGRVMKNVTGYDLVKLMCGSRGVLGVLTEVSLKVLPKPETSATLVWLDQPLNACAQVFRTVLSSPFEVSGAARLPQMDGQGTRTCIRVEGFEASVAYRVEKLKELLSGLPPDQILTEPKENAEIWNVVREVSCFAGSRLNIWKSVIKPSDLEAVVEEMHARTLIDWGGGKLWSELPPNTDLRALTARFGGHHTLVCGAGFDTFQPELAPVAKLSAALREKFEPRGLLNPGLMG